MLQCYSATLFDVSYKFFTRLVRLSFITMLNCVTYFIFPFPFDFDLLLAPLPSLTRSLVAALSCSEDSAPLEPGSVLFSCISVSSCGGGGDIVSSAGASLARLLAVVHKFFAICEVLMRYECCVFYIAFYMHPCACGGRL